MFRRMVRRNGALGENGGLAFVALFAVIFQRTKQRIGGILGKDLLQGSIFHDVSIGADVIVIGRVQGSLCLGKLFLRAIRHLDVDHLTHRIPDTHGAHHSLAVLGVDLHILHAGAIVKFDSTVFDEEG